MSPSALQDLFTPGSITFLLLTLVPGVLLLFRKKDGGRTGRVWIASLVLFYWVIGTPLTAVGLVNLLSPDVPPVMSKGDARGATAIVLLGAGTVVYRSRGESYSVPTREGSRRVLEAARVYHVLGGVPIIATGGKSESGLMAQQLEQLGVPAGRIIREGQSANTRDHAVFVPPVLKQHGLGRFVLVTSRQHIARALGVFRKAGTDPVPSTPEVYVPRGGFLEWCLPSPVALAASESLFHDLIGRVYYRVKGWA